MLESMKGKRFARNKAGRAGNPLYNPRTHPILIANLMLMGMKDEDVARLIGITRRTLFLWRKKDEFLKVYAEKEKAKADLPILEALERRARGYEVEETTLESEADGNGKRTGSKVRKIKKHIPADPTSMIFWLKNRHPAEWNDRREIKLSIEDLEKKKAELKALFDSDPNDDIPEADEPEK